MTREREEMSGAEVVADAIDRLADVLSPLVPPTAEAARLRAWVTRIEKATSSRSISWLCKQALRGDAADAPPEDD